MTHPSGPSGPGPGGGSGTGPKLLPALREGVILAAGVAYVIACAVADPQAWRELHAEHKRGAR
jgi:hypothetical protein